MPIDILDEKSVQEWISDAQRSGKLAPKTIHNMWKVLKMIVGKRSRDWEIRLPEISEEEQRYFIPEEVQKIIAAANRQYKVFFQTAFATGARSGELRGLRVEDVDIENRVIYIRRSTWLNQDTTPKTRAGFREMDVDQATIDMLKGHIGVRKEGRLFQTRNGTALQSGNIVKQELKPICKKIGIKHGGMHAFRHARVSLLQQNGVPGDLIKRWIGHSSLKTTSKYTHFPTEFRKEIVGKLGNIVPIVPTNGLPN